MAGTLLCSLLRGEIFVICLLLPLRIVWFPRHPPASAPRTLVPWILQIFRSYRFATAAVCSATLTMKEFGGGAAAAAAAPAAAPAAAGTVTVAVPVFANAARRAAVATFICYIDSRGWSGNSRGCWEGSSVDLEFSQSWILVQSMLVLL